MYVEGAGKRLQLWMGLRCQVQLEAMDQLGWTALLHACRNDMTEARRLTWSEASKQVNDVFCMFHVTSPGDHPFVSYISPYPLQAAELLLHGRADVGAKSMDGQVP